MALCTDDCETTRSLDLIRKFDVGTTTRHVGCDSHRTSLSGMLHDLCLACMLLGIEDLMVDTAHTEHSAEEF